MEDYMRWIWLGVIVLSAIGEVASMGLTSIWFTIGGIVALILSLFPGVPLWIEIVVFVILSLVLLLSLRGLTKKFLLANAKAKTNTDLLVGTCTRVLTQADFDNLGSVEINGVVWSIKSQDCQVLPKDSVVEIVEVQGNKLIVKKKEETQC